eukprot:gene553-8065_t
MNFEKPTVQDFVKDDYLLQKQKLDTNYDELATKIMNSNKELLVMQKEKEDLDTWYKVELEKLKIANQIDMGKENLKEVSDKVSEKINDALSSLKSDETQ